MGQKEVPGPSSGSSQPLEAAGCSTPRWGVGEDSPQGAMGHEAERIVFVGVEAGHGGRI